MVGVYQGWIPAFAGMAKFGVIRIITLLIFIFCIGSLAGKEKYISVEIDTSQAFPISVSVEQARSKTLQLVRQLAMEKALPQDVNLSSFTSSQYVEKNFQFDERIATSIFMNCSSSGRIISEEISNDYPYFPKKSQVYRYFMKYKAKILPLEIAYNPSIDMNVKLSKTLLKDKEEFSLTVTPNQDGYLYLFDYLPDNSVAMVFPTLRFPANVLKSGEAWQQKLTAVIAPDAEHSIETLYFVFSLEPIAGWESFKSNLSDTELVFNAGEESFMLFQKWLGKSDPMKRLEKMAQLHIFAD
ncbi:MAG: DUF4384 domain-containing protein [Candidatus Cloacimonetes bacterium]|nr:DUF4384 domain-containing protein [Candidatus Cloacimonadota bacterium]